MKHYFFFLWMSLAGMSQTVNASASYSAKVAMMQMGKPVLVEVTLPEFGAKVFSNDLVELKNLPQNMAANSQNCFCYELDDPRLAYVQAYYFGTKQLSQINYVLDQIDFSPLKKMDLILKPAEAGTMTHGSANGNEVTVSYAEAALDISVLAHEIGHFVHFNINSRLPILGPGSSHTLTMFFEGAANLFSALFTGRPTVGISYHDAAVSIVDFVRFPDLVPTQQEFYGRMIRAPLFTQRYPATAAKIQNLLDIMPVEMRTAPSPYGATAALNAPLWNAALRMGTSTVAEIYIKAFSEMRQDSTMHDLASAILGNTTDNELHSFLSNEFLLRGLSE